MDRRKDGVQFGGSRGDGSRKGVGAGVSEW